MPERVNPHVSTRFREQVRRVAVSQEGAGRWMQMVPDGTRATSIEDSDLELMLQRRGGLEISAAAAAHDVLERSGEVVDRKGDKLANGGEYNRRHQAVLHAGVYMVRAGAIGAIVQGDKEKPELTNMLNEDHIVDFAEIDGDPDGGGDVCYEVKVPSPLKKKFSEGNGSKAGGQPATVGHVHGFGSTYEEYHNTQDGIRPQAARLAARPPLQPQDWQGVCGSSQGPLQRCAIRQEAARRHAARRSIGRHCTSGASAHRQARSPLGGQRRDRPHHLWSYAHFHQVLLRPPLADACQGCGDV